MKALRILLLVVLSLTLFFPIPRERAKTMSPEDWEKAAEIIEQYYLLVSPACKNVIFDDAYEDGKAIYIVVGCGDDKKEGA